MNEYFKTKGKFRKFYEVNTDNNYSGLVDGATYDISIKFGRDKTQIPTEEMRIGLCDEIITITDINSGKAYKYSSFDDAFNAWDIDNYEENFLSKIDDRHNTYKRWYSPNVYVIAYHLEDMLKTFEYLCATISCIPILASPILAYKVVHDADYYKALSLEINKLEESSYVIMVTAYGKMTSFMQIIEYKAKEYKIPIIYTEDPTSIAAPEMTYYAYSPNSNNVSIESSENVKSEDLASNLNN